MITVDQAFSQIDSLISHPLKIESISLEQSLGRVLRETVTSPEDQPYCDRSSIDGYLLRPEQPLGKFVFYPLTPRLYPPPSFRLLARPCGS